MIEPYVLILLALAVARACVLMVEDIITEDFRVAVGSRFGIDHLLFRGVNCHWCWGIWFSGLFTTITYALTIPTFPTLTTAWYAFLSFLAVAFAGSYLASRV